ncbi:uncharacterized protein [Halyomorpha halys]|uniref:uncharacterized protein n=1 Tax=Halyomorpha halys TaxID=286706 RepID=UPI0034D1B49D
MREIVAKDGQEENGVPGYNPYCTVGQNFESSHSRNELQNYERFLTGVADNIQGYKSLNFENSAEVLLAFLALRGLDQQTRRQFELSRTSNDTFPSADDVISFVRQRKIALTLSRDLVPSSNANYDTSKETPRSHAPRHGSPKYRSVNFLHSGNSSGRKFNTHSRRAKSPSNSQTIKKQSPIYCPFCQNQHFLSRCSKFWNLSLEERKACTGSWKGCSNCLSANYSTSECKSVFTCRFCEARHYRLLHEDKPSSNTTSKSIQFVGFSSASQPELLKCSYILGTAKLFIVSPQQEFHTIRAVIDSGSQNSFISRAVVDRLGLSVKPLNMTITGLGGNSVVKPAGSLDFILRSRMNGDEFKTSAIVVNTICPQLPCTPIENHVTRHLSRYKLADDSFHSPLSIDLLIGIDLYPRIISGAPFSAGVDELYLQPTVFGLVVMGKACGPLHPHSSINREAAESVLGDIT